MACVSMALPLGLFGVVMVAAGGLTVRLYRRLSPQTRLNAAMGAKLGALSGALGFAVFAAIAITAVRSSAYLREVLFQAVEKSAASNPDPQVHALLAQIRTPEGLAAIVAICLGMMLVIFLILCTIGGAVTAATLRKRPQ